MKLENVKYDFEWHLLTTYWDIIDSFVTGGAV